MSMKRVAYRLWGLICLFSMPYLSIKGQNGLDDLKVIYQQDFEDNSVGGYTMNDWNKDWPGAYHTDRIEECDIAQDHNDPVNSSKTLQYNFPEGTISPWNGGGQWFFNFPKQDEVYISYDLMFMAGFEFQKGGKLPSAIGGDFSTDKPTGYDGFTAGLMFKSGGNVAFYCYWPDQMLEQGGTSFAWGVDNYPTDYFLPSSVNYSYASGDVSYCIPGKWHNITYRIVMNTINSAGTGNYDGILEGYFDGNLVGQVTHMLFRHTSSIGTDCMRMYSFFGGGDASYNTPKDEWMRVDNVLIYAFKDNIDVPRGQKLSPTSRKINYWRNFGDTPAQVDPPVVDPPLANKAPVINNQEFKVTGPVLTNNLIGKIQAYDTDTDQKLTFSISSGNDLGLYTIDAVSGELKTTTSDIFGAGSTTNELVVKASDNGEDILSSTATIKVVIIGNATTVYIDPRNNNDNMQNGSMSHPYDSWNDVTWKDGNTYLQKRGTNAICDKIIIGADNITIGAYGSGDDLPVISSETTTYLISAFDRKNITISNIHLDSKNALSCLYFLGTNSDNIIIEKCYMESLGNAARIIEGKKVTFKYNTVLSSNEGIFSSAISTHIYYNIFKNNNTAVNVNSSQSNVNIFNNVFVDNKNAVTVSFADLILYNNIFYSETENQKAISSKSGKLISDYNIFYPEISDLINVADVSYNSLEMAQKNLQIDLHSFNTDPLFVDIYNDVFDVKSTSPAINKGINLNISNDLSGKVIPYAKVTDIGAFELYEKVPELESQIAKLTVYPNPSSGIVNIKIEKTETSNQSETEINQNSSFLKIIDSFGRTIFSKLIEDNTSQIEDMIDLSSISNGLYFIVYQIADKVVSQKLILNNNF